MTFKRKLIPAFLFALLFYIQLSAQTIVLPRSTPEGEGVSSQYIIEFLDAVAKSKNEMHSLMILRHGKVITQGWWNPYRSDLKHTLYSLSKSFTSSAVGFAVSEKRISLDDKVISFFPDKLPDTLSNYFAELTIKNLITMSVGQAPDPTGKLVSQNTDWIKSFFTEPIRNKPGTMFLYNSMATYMLSAIVQKVTGQKIIDYLKPRLFDPLGIKGMDWETDPVGINTGGWGLRIKTEDIARFGQLYLQKGKWNGKQILPTSWVEEATSFKVDNAPGAAQSKKDSSDWMQGYCYQFWRCRYNNYRGDGAFGQYCIILPEEDAVIAITSETPDMQDELNLVWKYLLPAMQVDKSSLNKNDAVALQKRLRLLKIPFPGVADSTFRPTSVSGKAFNMEANSKKIKSISFSEKNHIITLTLKTDKDLYALHFGQRKWYEAKTTMLGPSLVDLAKNHFAGLPPSQIEGSYSWKGNSVLEMQLRYIDSPHTLVMTFYFDGDKILVDMLDSFKTPDKKITLKGEAGK